MAVLEMTSRARRTACLCAGAVYTDVLCRCVNKRSSCVSRRRAPADHDDAGDNDVDDDVAATSRRAAATTVEPETAALSTVLATASRASRSRCGLTVSIPLSSSCRSAAAPASTLAPASALSAAPCGSRSRSVCDSRSHSRYRSLSDRRFRSGSRSRCGTAPLSPRSVATARPMIVAVDFSSPDVIEMQRMGRDADDRCPVAAL